MLKSELERTKLSEVGVGTDEVVRIDHALLASADPVLLMGESNLAVGVRNLRLAAGDKVRPVAVATYDHDVLGAVEYAAATIDVEIDTLRNTLGTLRLEATVVPADLDLGKGELRHVVTSREGKLDHLSARAAVGKDRSGAGLSLDRITGTGHA